ncbi:MAG: septum formation initiator family protein [Bacteroidaceae bacterium]|nr:septum formation initiator family protein [Bacteroidaceae bacterium]
MGKLVKHIFLKYRYIIVAVIFLLIISFVGDHSLVNRVKQKQEIASLKEQIREQVEQYNTDKHQLEQLKTDPEAVKRIAHEKYYMKTENEDIFVIED